MFDPIVPGVIEQHRSLLLQSNPMLSQDLNEVAAKLRVELAPRRAELACRCSHASTRKRFTEQELKDCVAFYKTPLGKKLIEQEPQVLDEAMKARASDWADKLAEEVGAEFAPR